MRLLTAVMGRIAVERVFGEVESVDHEVGEVLVGLRVEARRALLAGLHHIGHALLRQVLRNRGDGAIERTSDRGDGHLPVTKERQDGETRLVCHQLQYASGNVELGARRSLLSHLEGLVLSKSTCQTLTMFNKLNITTY